MRALDYDQTSALRKETLRTGLIVEIDHPRGFVRAWTGVGDLDWKGEVYKGLGLVSRIQTVSSTQKLRIQEIKLILRALPEDLERTINANVRNRKAQIWLALLDENFRVSRAEPILVSESRLDRQQVEIKSSGVADLILLAFNGLRELEIASSLRWSPEDQKRTYPDDVGLDRVHLYENREVTWTRI